LAADTAVITIVSTAAPAVIAIVPLNEPDVLGANATLIVQVDPGARLAAQVVPIAANGPVKAGIPRFAPVPPEFVSMTVSADDWEPGGVVSKIRVVGEATTLAGTVGGVAVPPSGPPAPPEPPLEGATERPMRGWRNTSEFADAFDASAPKTTAITKPTRCKFIAFQKVSGSSVV
jgi:hypothetical protein